MKNGFRVVDADRHIIEPPDLFERYMEPAYRGRVTLEGPQQSIRKVDGELVSDAFKLPEVREPSNIEGARIFGGDQRYASAFAEAIAAGFDPASNLRDMDKEGVDLGVLFPTLGLYIIWKSDMDPKVSAAICRAYNNWLAEYCSADPNRLKGVMLIPLQDTKLAVEELKRAKNELGLVGIFWRPNPVKGRKLDHPDYLPIYEAAADLGVAICVHEGARTILPQAGNDRYSEFGRHVACHPLEQMLASLTFCADGLLERIPELKVGFLEAGCGWLPFWLERIDEHWEHYSLGRARTTKEPPSAYFKRQCFISTEAGEELVPVVAEHVGEDQIVMATDYPHPDAVDKFPDHTVGDLVNNHELSDVAKRKILWDNPARFYNLADVPASAGAAAAAAR